MEKILIKTDIWRRPRPDVHLEGIVDGWYSSALHGNQGVRNKDSSRRKDYYQKSKAVSWGQKDGFLEDVPGLVTTLSSVAALTETYCKIIHNQYMKENLVQSNPNSPSISSTGEENLLWRISADDDWFSKAWVASPIIVCHQGWYSQHLYVTNQLDIPSSNIIKGIFPLLNIQELINTSSLLQRYTGVKDFPTPLPPPYTHKQKHTHTHTREHWISYKISKKIPSVCLRTLLFTLI